MAAIDEFVVKVNVTGSTRYEILPAQVGKRIRCWRIILGAMDGTTPDSMATISFSDVPNPNPLSLTNTVGSEYWFGDRSGFQHPYDARALIVTEVGRPLYLEVDNPNLHIKGSMRMEYFT